MFKVTNKGNRTTSSESFSLPGLKHFNADVDNLIICWELVILPFRGKIPSF